MRHGTPAAHRVVVRWTPTDAERFIAEMDLGLRVGGAGPLVHRLVDLADGFPDPASWCVGLGERRALLLVADADRLAVLERVTW